MNLQLKKYATEQQKKAIVLDVPAYLKIQEIWKAAVEEYTQKLLFVPNQYII